MILCYSHSLTCGELDTRRTLRPWEAFFLLPLSFAVPIHSKMSSILRRGSLIVALFPWMTSVPVSDKESLTEVFSEDEDEVIRVSKLHKRARVYGG